MKKIILLAVFYSCTTPLFSQNIFKRNAAYVELGGNGLFTSLNYERQFTSHPGFGARVGAGIYFTNHILTLPVGINYLVKLSSSHSFIDVGFGVTYTRADVTLYSSTKPSNPNYINTHYINYVPSVGFRRQTSKNWMFRLSLTPVFNQYDGLPFIGASIGKCF